MPEVSRGLVRISCRRLIAPTPVTSKSPSVESQTLPITMVAVGNTPWYGGGLKICPGADPTDGLFDVTVVGASSRLELMRTKPRLTTGTHVDHPSVSVFRASRVELSSPGVTTYADGEPVAPLPAVAECVPGALAVIGTGRA